MTTSGTMADMRKLDPDDRRPAYLQVAEALRADIDEGELHPGEKLPSHHELVSHFGVSPGTVKRALGELQGAGIVVSRQGQGAFVRTKRASPAQSGGELAELRKVVADLTERVEVVERRLADL